MHVTAKGSLVLAFFNLLHATSRHREQSTFTIQKRACRPRLAFLKTGKASALPRSSMPRPAFQGYTKVSKVEQEWWDASRMHILIGFNYFHGEKFHHLHRWVRVAVTSSNNNRTVMPPLALTKQSV